MNFLIYLLAMFVPPVLAFRGTFFRGAWIGLAGIGLLLAACFGGAFAACFYRKRAMAKVAGAVLLVLALSLGAHAQTPKTTTHCTRSGDDIDCETTDNSAQIAAQAEQDKANTEAGAAVGRAMGGAFVAMAQHHAFNKMVKQYCSNHRGETWKYRQPFADGSPNPNGAILHEGTCKK